MPSSERRRRLAWMIAIRAIIATILLGAGPLIQLSGAGVVPTNPFYFLVALTYAFTAVFAATLRFVERWPWWADAQLISDVFVITGFIAVTGGITSYFSLLYVLPIIAASSLMRRRGALTVATLTSLAYATTVLIQYQGAFAGFQSWVQPQALPPVRVAQTTAAINIFTFLAVGWLSGSLAERVRSAGVRLERASTEIANLQAFNQDVIDSLTSGLLTTDINGRILSFNRAAEVITGYAFDSVAGRDVGDALCLPVDVRESFAPDLQAAPAAPRRFDFQYPTASGRPIELGISVGPLLTPGGKKGYLVTFQDITEFKRMEQEARLKQRLAAVGEMAAGIAHEIRNPLASMAGSIQVLREELSLNSEQAQLMDIVLRESKRLNETIRGFLAYARPQRTSVERLDLAKTVSDTAMLLRNSSDVQLDHTIEVDLPPSPVWYDADEGQIRQILWNLATNGLRAMPHGGRLRLAALLTKPGAEARAGHAVEARERTGLVVLEVQDEGVGIPAEQLDRIFQPFHGSFARGSGLGLAIVHRIVTDYNGEIQVTSKVGEGTMVRVLLGPTPEDGDADGTPSGAAAV
jgi:two-component system, NtrC family, sensor histidine kinase PilS